MESGDLLEDCDRGVSGIAHKEHASSGSNGLSSECVVVQDRLFYFPLTTIFKSIHTNIPLDLHVLIVGSKRVSDGRGESGVVGGKEERSVRKRR